MRLAHTGTQCKSVEINNDSFDPANNPTWQLVLGEGLVTLSKVGHF
jgi:hypothetical protein